MPTNYQPVLGLHQFVVTRGIYPQSTQTSVDPNYMYLGSIRSFAGNFSPIDTGFAEGQTLLISEHSSLFDLIGTTYGGDGQTTFKLPDLNDRLMVGHGSHTTLGQAFGSSDVTIARTNLPADFGGSNAPIDNHQPSLGIRYLIYTGGSAAGQIVPFLGNFTPEGYLWANGATLNISDYPELKAAIGNKFGGDGTTTFMLPDLRDRTIIGAGQGYPDGTVVGSDTASITGSTLNDIIGTPIDNHQPSMALKFIIAVQGIYPSREASSVPEGMTNQFLGEVRAFAGDTIPVGWALADGSTLPIAQNTALFSLLGTIYGGNGQTNFQLPNLVGRAMTEPGSDIGLGAQHGTPTIVLTASDLPNADPTGTLTVDGTAEQGAVLTAADAVVDADGRPALSTYQWQRQDGSGTWVDVNGATSTTYTLTQADVGHAVRVRLSYTDNLGHTERVTSTATVAIANVNDPPTGTLTVAGTAAQGEVLTATDTVVDFDGRPALSTYQWQRQDGSGTWVNINGATGTTYTLTQADVGHAVRVMLSYTDDLGTPETVTSTATVAIANVNDPPTGTLTVAGTAAQGALLTATDAVVDADGRPALSTYQWQRQDGSGNWVDINGATSTTYTLTQADVGHAVRVRLSYTDDLGHSETVTSTATVAIANVNDPPTGTLTVAGAAAQGEVLTATDAVVDADGRPALSTYQWQRQDGSGNWVDINGATSTTYTLTQADVGHAVRVRLSYTDDLGHSETVNSTATATVTAPNAPPAGAPTVTGTVVQGAVLTVTDTVVDTDGRTTPGTYQWQREDGSGGWVNINGATGATYTLVQADVGHAVRVVLAYTDDLGTPETVSSSATAIVSAAAMPPSNALPTGTLTVTGTVVQGAILTVTDTVVDTDGRATPGTYQWQRQDGSGAWVNITGATGTTFTLTSAEVGHAVRVVLAYTDSRGTLETFSGAASATVTANAPPTGPVDPGTGSPNPPPDTGVDDPAPPGGGAVGGGGGAPTPPVDGSPGSSPTDGQPPSGSGPLAALMPKLESALETYGISVEDPAALLPILSVIFPGALASSGDVAGPGRGQVPPSRLDFDVDSLPAGANGLLNALLGIALGLDAKGAGFVTDDGSGRRISATAQSLVIQADAADGRVITFGVGDDATSFASGTTAGLAWSREFAQKVLRSDFDPASVISYDGSAQAAARQSDTKSGAPLAVKIDGQEASAPHAALSSAFGLADFLNADGGSAVGVARLVTTAHTLGGADDQQVTIRMRQNGMQDVEVMFYKVGDYTGMVNGLRPGDAGYDAASRAQAYQTDTGATWISGAGYGRYGEARLVGVDDGDLIAMRISSGGHHYYMFASANETENYEGVNHVWNYGLNTWGWEDLYGGGDRDFNDLVVQMDFTSAALPDALM